MLINALTSFRPSFTNILKDKINLILSLIPITIGIILYWFAGKTIYSSIMDWGNQLIEQYISSGGLGTILYYLVSTILSIMLFFMVNWTFVLVVALIASPFNDIMSARIEKIINGESPIGISESFTILGQNIFKTLINEVKKVALIIVLTMASVIFGYIPILTPISVVIAILLLAIEFLDYSWSRHGLTIKSCLKDIRANFFDYTLGGAFFFILVSIPFVNLIVPPLATSYFTTLWVKSNENRSQVTK